MPSPSGAQQPVAQSARLPQDGRQPSCPFCVTQTSAAFAQHPSPHSTPLAH
jgi:hypothetical protein